jgi:hypothetical protein
MNLGGCQYEYSVRRWFLERFEQSVERGITEHMHFIYYVNFVASQVGSEVYLLSEFSDIIHACI